MQSKEKDLLDKALRFIGSLFIEGKVDETRTLLLMNQLYPDLYDEYITLNNPQKESIDAKPNLFYPRKSSRQPSILIGSSLQKTIKTAPEPISKPEPDITIDKPQILSLSEPTKFAKIHDFDNKSDHDHKVDATHTHTHRPHRRLPDTVIHIQDDTPLVDDLLAYPPLVDDLLAVDRLPAAHDWIEVRRGMAADDSRPPCQVDADAGDRQTGMAAWSKFGKWIDMDASSSEDREENDGDAQVAVAGGFENNVCVSRNDAISVAKTDVKAVAAIDSTNDLKGGKKKKKKKNKKKGEPSNQEDKPLTEDIKQKEPLAADQKTQETKKEGDQPAPTNSTIPKKYLEDVPLYIVGITEFGQINGICLHSQKKMARLWGDGKVADFPIVGETENATIWIRDIKAVGGIII